MQNSRHLNLSEHIFYFLLSLLITLLSRNLGIFWDNVLYVSKIGAYLYENGFYNWLLPNEIDAGHQPFIGSYMAIIWHIFGKNLTISHLAMTPFLWGFFFQLKKTIDHYISNKTHQWGAFILIILAPTMASQIAYVNPEIIQTFFFLIAINGVLKNNNANKILGLLFLGVITYRGTMLCAGVFLWDIGRSIFINHEKISVFIKRNFVPYLIGALPAIAYIIFRLATKGWLKTHPESQWASGWQIVDLQFFLRNCVVLVHRYLDFGRIFIFIFLSIIFLKDRNLIKNKNVKDLLFLALFSVLLIIGTSLIYTNPMGHRYFMVSYMAIFILSIYLIEYLKLHKLIYFTLFLGLIGGNLWIYPEKIAQGWDATLASTPYFELRIDAIEYMDKNDIPIEETGTFFSNYSKVSDTDLSGDNRSFKRFESTNTKYALYSNVYNLSDEDLKTIAKDYTLIKEFESCRIYIKLYQRKI